MLTNLPQFQDMKAKVRFWENISSLISLFIADYSTRLI